MRLQKCYCNIKGYMNKKITIIGTGYVGLSLAVLLAQNNEVIAYDIDCDKVNKINAGKCPFKDEYLEQYLSEKELNLIATTDSTFAYQNSDYMIVAVPTDYDADRNLLNTVIIEDVIKEIISLNNKSIILIKSTIPMGFTERIRDKYNYENIYFSPEFLRESKALYDNLYPSRIIVGINEENLVEKAYANDLIELLLEGTLKDNVATAIMGLKEAESVKLFANSYLAMRVGFFNELDTYAEVNGLNSKAIIEGVCLDLRIGECYNNPSFGYGGYCLPKDTKQLLANFNDVPQNLIQAIVDSNATRKQYIVDRIIQKCNNLGRGRDVVVGIFRLIMKTQSDNFRESSVLEIISELELKGVNIIVFETSEERRLYNKKYIFVEDINEFKQRADIIIANRYDVRLDDVKDKVYSRDCFGTN